jgi:hypothetical protein
VSQLGVVLDDRHRLRPRHRGRTAESMSMIPLVVLRSMSNGEQL